MIDIRIGDNDGGDRAGALGIVGGWMKGFIVVDLLAQVG